MEPISVKELSDRYPHSMGNGEISRNKWADLLRKWRLDGKLIERTHYMQKLVGTCNMRVYSLPRIVRLIIAQVRAGTATPRVRFLYEQYVEDFCAVLEEDQAERTARTAAAPTGQDAGV